MKIMSYKSVAVMAAFGLLIISSAIGVEQKAPTQEQVLHQVDLLKKQISRIEGRVNSFADEIAVLDNEIEAGVSEILKLLESIQDSTDSKTRVTMTKKNFAESLIKSMKFYQNRRAKRLENLRMGNGYLPTEAELQALKYLDQHIEKRIDQVIDLSKTLAQHKEWSRYQKYQRTGYRSYKISDDYRRYTKNLSKSDQMSGKVFDAIEGDIDAIGREIQKLTNNSPLQSGRANESFWQERIKYYQEIEKKRKKQLVQLISSPPPSGKKVSRKTAFEISKWIDDMVLNLGKDNRRLIQLSTQRNEELRYLKKWQDRFQQAEAYLERTY